MAVQIQLRRDTAANWTATNPVLVQGEPGLETDTGKIKYGDGTTAWTSLAYAPAAAIVDGTIVNADINASAAIVDTKLATISTAGKVSNSATTATSANTASAIVARDGSGNFSAGTITAALTGAASSNVLKAGDTMTGALATPLGSAATPSLTFTGDPNTGIYSPGADQVAVATNGTGRLFVDSGGNVNVGLSGALPTVSIGDRILSVRPNSGSSEIVLFIADAIDTAFSHITFGGIRTNTGATARISANRRGEIVFGNNDAVNGVNTVTERLRITSAGLVGIGTSAPNVPLEVVGNIHMSGAADRTIFNRANNALSLGTNNATRLHITNAGNVGIGTTSPSAPLEVVGNIRASAASGTVELGAFSGSTQLSVGTTGSNSFIFSNGNIPLVFSTFGTERARIDSSGRLLVGTSSARAVGSNFAATVGTETSTYIGYSAVNNTNDSGGSVFVFGKSRGTAAGSSTIVQNNDALGVITFAGADGVDLQTSAAQISVFVDGTPGANDMPGRLTFSTTADGASSPTERLRITSAGVLQIAEAGNITVGTTTGTKIGTATTQKLGFYNATPVVQPAAVADATDAASVITQLNDLLARLRTLGIIAT